MIKEFKEFSTSAVLKIADQDLLETYKRPKLLGLYTFIWTNTKESKIVVDGIPLTLGTNKMLALTPIQTFQFIEGDGLIVYQFNREFYCIKDHDKEVGCAGLLFFGNAFIPILNLNDDERKKFKLLHHIFLDELETKDNIQAEMLRMLMTRFIIKATRLLKNNSDNLKAHESKIDLLRHFNVLVEEHFKEAHSVKFYADKLYKSPKTLSNTFAKLNKSPLRIIHNRLVLEIKRQLMYTNRSAKEIAFDVGFEDGSHLSRLFKKHTGISPSQFQKTFQTN